MKERVFPNEVWDQPWWICVYWQNVFNSDHTCLHDEDVCVSAPPPWLLVLPVITVVYGLVRGYRRPTAFPRRLPLGRLCDLLSVSYIIDASHSEAFYWWELSTSIWSLKLGPILHYRRLLFKSICRRFDVRDVGMKGFYNSNLFIQQHFIWIHTWLK